MDEKVNELIQALGNPETCLQASWELAKMGSHVVEAVINALTREGYKDDRVGIYACIVLGNIKDPRAVPPLIDALKKNPSWEVRRRAAWALGEIKDQRVIGPLIDALTGDTNPDVRAFSAAALGKLGDKRALRPLIEALDDLEQTDDYSLVCFHAIGALGGIGGRGAIDALLKLLKLGIPSSLADPTVSLLAGLAGTKTVITYNDTARLLAASTLGKIGDESVIRDLKDLVKREHSEFVRSALEKVIQELEERQGDLK
jgi:HEAT repeat protein